MNGWLEDDEFGGGSQLTSSAVRALDNMNNTGQYGGDMDYSPYGDEMYDPHQQGTGDFQDL